jgi:hypothetical protein
VTNLNSLLIVTRLNILLIVTYLNILSILSLPGKRADDGVVSMPNVPFVRIRVTARRGLVERERSRTVGNSYNNIRQRL